MHRRGLRGHPALNHLVQENAMAVTQKPRPSDQPPGELTDGQVPPTPDEIGPHDVPDDEVIEMTLPEYPHDVKGRDPAPPGPMDTWKVALREGLVAGTAASLLSTAVLAACGRRETGSAFAPTNAVSHWLWGDEALRAQELSWRHTLAGYVTHHLSSVFWAALYSRIYGYRDTAKKLPQAIAGGVATSAVACLVDYTLVPKRLTPGFEHRLSTSAMVTAYGALAAGFALGALLLRQRD
jgi:hypothetical protein